MSLKRIRCSIRGGLLLSKALSMLEITVTIAV